VVPPLLRQHWNTGSRVGFVAIVYASARREVWREADLAASGPRMAEGEIAELGAIGGGVGLSDNDGRKRNAGKEQGINSLRGHYLVTAPGNNFKACRYKSMLLLRCGVSRA